MKFKNLRVNGNTLFDEFLLPHLKGRVFHVTRLSVLSRIQTSGAILVNTDGHLETLYGSSRSFFRTRGCVPVFDYRTASPEQLEDSMMKCSPFPGEHKELAYLFLARDEYAKLQP